MHKLSALSIAVHFWAPTFKWGISIANIADFAKPPEKLSYPQQIGICMNKNIMCSLSWCGYFQFSLPCLTNMCNLHAPALSKSYMHTLLYGQAQVSIILLCFTSVLCLPDYICYAAVTATGVIWSRYSTVIIPVSLNADRMACL